MPGAFLPFPYIAQTVYLSYIFVDEGSEYFPLFPSTAATLLPIFLAAACVVLGGRARRAIFVAGLECRRQI